MHILVIEDDREAARLMVRGLRDSGHLVDHAADGTDGLAMAQAGHYDALVVDRMLPGLDGLVVVSRLREEGFDTPILFLSPLVAVGGRVSGPQAGGPDEVGD